MGRFHSLTLLGLTAALAFSQAPQPQQPPKPKDPPASASGAAKPQDPVEVEPPEEDEALRPREYTFNPLEAQRDVRTGEYYFKKGNFKAAAKRFEEATLYDPGLADAYLRLGESREKLHDKKGAKAAFAKFIELKPDSKLAPVLKKKIS